MSDWAWSHDADNAETVVLPEQRAIAVYANHKGTIVIRQEGDWNDDEDSLIFVQPEHAERVARAIVHWAREVLGDRDEVEDAQELGEVRRTHKARGESLSSRKPWVAEGVSRRTWYRRAAKADGTTGTGTTGTTLSPSVVPHQAPSVAPDAPELFQREEANQLSGAGHG